MMDFAPFRPRRRTGENIVPMINVVFLLLIFFLMSAQIAPPDPFDVTLPTSSEGDEMGVSDTLYIGPDGLLAFEGITGQAALDAVAQRKSSVPLNIRADALLSATTLAQVLPRLAAAGVSEVLLITGDARH